VELDNEEYKCKFCDNMIIAGYRCVDCYLNKIDKIPTKPYMDEDFMKGYEDTAQPKPGFPFIPNPLTDEARLRGFRYDPFKDVGTTTGDLPTYQPTTTTGTTVDSYNPWFRRTWANGSAIQDSTTVDFSTSSSAQNLGN